jgi:hypothetical protein
MGNTEKKIVAFVTAALAAFVPAVFSYVDKGTTPDQLGWVWLAAGAFGAGFAAYLALLAQSPNPPSGLAGA